MTAAIQWLTIPTAQRPAELRRAVESFSKHLARHENDVPIAVFHSPATHRAQEEVKAALAAAAEDGAAAPVYVGIDAKVALAKELRRAADVPAALLDLALFNPLRLPAGAGANRNAVLLWGAGQRLLSTDDDTLAEFSFHPESDAGGPLDPCVVAGDPADYFVRSESELVGTRVAGGEVPRCRGIVGEILSVWSAAAAAGHRSPLVFAGLSGDCGWGAPFGFFGVPVGYLLLPTDSLRKLTGSESDWRAALTCRNLMRVVRQPRLSRGAPGMTTTFGIDATSTLPPFLPTGRGEDLLFCAMVERFSHAPSAHVPLAVAHAPAPGRRFQEGELWRSAQSLDLCRVFFAFLETLPVGANLAQFGRHLQAQTAGGDRGFVSALREARRCLGLRLVAEARQRAAELNSLPSFWHDDLERYCLLTEAAWRAPELPWVFDTGARDAEDSLRRTRAFVASYGALCEAWSAIWASAASRHEAAPEATGRLASASTKTHACSPWQRGFLQLYLRHPTDTTSIILDAYRGHGPVNDKFLEVALRAVAERHEALRSRLAPSDGLEPRLEVRPASDLVLERLDSFSPADIETMRAAQQTRPFDLRGTPPLRLSLVRSVDGQSWEIWLAVHHGFFDGFSLNVFWRELSAAYANLNRNQEIMLNLSPVGQSYYARAGWIRQLLTAEIVAARERHWIGKLAGATEAAPVSWRPQNPHRDDACWLVKHEAAASLSGRLRHVAATLHVSIASLCLAAWQTVIHHWSSEPDILIGVDIANRWDEADEQHIGLFAAALPVRISFATDRTVFALIEAVHADLTDALAHGCLPAEHMARLVTHQRRKYTLFPLMFSYFEQHLPAFADLSMSPITFERGQASYDLGLKVDDPGSALQFSLLGNGKLFDQEDLRRLAAALVCILEQIAANRGMRVAELRYTSPQDDERIEDWNSTAMTYPRDSSLTELLRATAERVPGNLVLQTVGESLSYGELWRRAEALAMRLRRRGVRRDGRVALFLDRHPSTLEGMLGILLAGGGYLPIDRAFPSARIAFMLDDAAVTVIVTRRDLAGDLPRHSAEVVCLDEDEVPGTMPAGWQGPTPESLAYVIYTSGSTGLPKGVEVTHRALVNFLFSMLREPGFTPHDVMLALTTISFDIAGLELWLPQLVGARLWLAGREEVADGELLAEALARSQATVMQATPTTWRLLLDSRGWTGDAKLKALVGGEALPPDLGWRLARACGEAWNLYGPTEATIWSTLWRIPREQGSVRIGRPIANTEIHVLDRAHRPQPLGVSGDLYIGGEGVARGYLGRPELTAERFVADPFRGGAARMYRTGDLARWMPDGELDFAGRSDAQIKINGYRIEPGEVEAAILQLPEIGQAAVGIVQGPAAEPRLVAFAVPRPGFTMPSSPEMRGRLRGFLLDHMLPQHFVSLETLPFTSNGKLDRSRLAALYRPPAEEAPAVDNLSERETAVVDEFALILGQRHGVDVDFFEAGGNSLMALQLMLRLQKRFALPIAAGEIFLNSTAWLMSQRIATLAARCDAQPINHLVMMRSDVTGPLLAFVHPQGGNLLAYAVLAPQIDAKIALYGLEGYSQRQYQSLQQRATVYAEELSLVRPEGRIALCGYSLGGSIALEIAAQLERQGRSVGPVFLIDTSVPQKSPDAWHRLIWHIAELRRYTNAERRLWFNWLLRRLTHRAPSEVTDDPDQLGGSSMELQMRHLAQQSLTWQLPQYTGSLILFRAEMHPQGYSRPPSNNGWGSKYPQLEIFRWKYDHKSILAGSAAHEMAREINRRF